MLTDIHPKLPMRNKQVTKEFYLNKLGFNKFGNADYEEYLMLEKDQIQIHFLLFKAPPLCWCCFTNKTTTHNTPCNEIKKDTPARFLLHNIEWMNICTIVGSIQASTCLEQDCYVSSLVFVPLLPY